MTNFRNPNRLDFTKEEYNDNFDALYLIIKLANSFSWSGNNDDEQLKPEKAVNSMNEEAKIVCDTTKKPIFMADGLVTLDILNSMSENMPPDIIFCPTPLTAIAKRVLSDYLNVSYRSCFSNISI